MAAFFDSATLRQFGFALEESNQVSLDRQDDLLPIRGMPGSFNRRCRKPAAFENLRQDLFLGIEVVVDATSLDPRRAGNLAQRGGAIREEAGAANAHPAGGGARRVWALVPRFQQYAQGRSP